jgi:2,3-bisphosphoglycerate-independent phosphoglycerate mutase
MKKVCLIIMDGWGKGAVAKADAIAHAHTPFVKSLYSKYPNSELITCGTLVGLPDGQMGNSEVGHLNLGAGRIVYQELERINVAIRTGELAKNEQLLQAIHYAKQNNKALHLMGLVSDGGVHSHINQLKALTSLCQAHGLTKVFIHAFTDGRDTDPKSGLGFLQDLQSHINDTIGKIATVCGRYYAMDRDKRWERVRIAYDALVHGKGTTTNNYLAAIQQSYTDGVSDEFILPIINIDEHGAPIATIQKDDAVLCFNFRTDRCREITIALTQQDFPEQAMQTIPLHYTTFTEYDKTYKGVHVLFKNDDLVNTLGEVIAAHGKTQLRIAETEKYPHVSFFFSGGREAVFNGEERIVIPSPKEVATYDLKPEMSAPEVAQAAIDYINEKMPHFVCLNFANADMVGHTGVWDAVLKAVATVDACVERLVNTCLQHDYTILLTADHGNSDYMINEDGSPNTAHTLNPVPLFLINKEASGSINNGKLGDIAPTILTLMNLPIPNEMTGEVLVS